MTLPSPRHRVALPRETDRASLSLQVLHRLVQHGGDHDTPLAWHEMEHLAERAERRELPDIYMAASAADVTERVARVAAFALETSIHRASTDTREEQLIRLLPALWWLDRTYGLDVFRYLDAAAPRATVDFARRGSGRALLSFLAESGSPEDVLSSSPEGLVVDLTAVGAADLDPNGGTTSWSVLARAAFRHVAALVAGNELEALLRWLRLCTNRMALRYVASLDVLRQDPRVVAMCILRGGPREVAVGLAALHRASQDARVRAAVSELARRDAALSATRVPLLLALLDALPRPQEQLRDALLGRAAELFRGATPEPLATDFLLPLAHEGRLEAALLIRRALPPNDLEPAVVRVLDGFVARLAGDEASDATDETLVPEALVRAWHMADEGTRGRLREMVIDRLAAAESYFGGRAGRASGDPEEAARVATVIGVALTLGRRLPHEPGSRSFCLALYEQALRMRVVHGDALGASASLATLEALMPLAPDPREDGSVNAVRAFLKQWYAFERGLGLELPPPEPPPTVKDPTLGVATL